MRVLITGVTGFIGGHLARRLAAAGVQVIGLATDRPAREICELYEIDILDRSALADAVERCAPDAVVHLAGLSHVGQSWGRPGDYLRVNFAGTRNVLHAAAGRRVIVASSAEVYGKVPEDEQPIAEDRSLEPLTPYAMTKACAEELARDRGAIVARAFNVIGAGQSLDFAMPSFADQLAAIRRDGRRPVLRVGNLSARRDFLHVADAAAAYQTLIESGEAGGVYNVARGEAWSIRDMLDRLRAISGVEVDVERDEQRMRPVDAPLLLGDSRRLRALGWAPRHDLDQAVRDIWQAAIDA